MVEIATWLIYLMFPNGNIRVIAVVEDEKEAKKIMEETKDEVERFMAPWITDRDDNELQLSLPL